jgi:hypothetical protein
MLCELKTQKIMTMHSLFVNASFGFQELTQGFMGAKCSCGFFLGNLIAMYTYM